MTRNTHRYISERWVIKGKLELTSPAHFGNGEDDTFTGADPAQRSRWKPVFSNLDCWRPPKLPARTRKRIWQARPICKTSVERDLYATLLFGGYRGDDEGSQSPLVVHDFVGSIKEMELRDGVSINAETRTAEDDQKFDIQLLSAGTTFDLTFELSFGNSTDAKSPKMDREKLLEGLALALEGFSNSQITLGARKRRGYGQCKVEKWSVIHFDMKDLKTIPCMAYIRSRWIGERRKSKRGTADRRGFGI